MYQIATADASTSTIESRPNATSASEPAAMPRPIVTKTSMTFHPMVAISSRLPRARSESWSPLRVIACRSSRAGGRVGIDLDLDEQIRVDERGDLHHRRHRAAVGEELAVG